MLNLEGNHCHDLDMFLCCEIISHKKEIRPVLLESTNSIFLYYGLSIILFYQSDLSKQK